MFAILCFLLLGTTHLSSAPASHRIFDEVTFKTLDFEFSMLLKNHLRDWRYLTETATVMDTGEFFSKKHFLPRTAASWINVNKTLDEKSDQVSAPQNYAEQPERQNITYEVSTSTSHMQGCSKCLEKNGETLEVLKSEVSMPPEEHKGARTARDAGVPVIYMPGSKKKRKCSQVSGILAGFNTFNYLTFVTGVVTLILNVNNNINNNNNNNNLNNNNDISNNNVNSNTNTQNGNQVVIFPPGRKRRNVVDWILQAMYQPPVDGRPASGQSSHSTAWCVATEAAMLGLQLFDSWVEANSGVKGECGWAEYCQLLHNLPTRKGLPAVLFDPTRNFSTLVAPEWVGSSASCFLHRAKCHLV